MVDNPYPGPQTQRALAAFSNAFTGQPEALAALGFAVVALDERGTPGRDKAFHDASHGDHGEAWHVEDHVAAIRQLAARYPWLDAGRVGVFGSSGGGFAAARAMFTRPDFYRVGVSISGNHDWRHYIPAWSHLYLGKAGRWADVDNARVAEDLRGRLLLVHGELDDNVLPSQTLRVVDALIAADKDFDLLVVLGEHHASCTANPYVTRRVWDYFVRHLLGATPPEYVPSIPSRSTGMNRTDEAAPTQARH
ncbi:Prolyl oligopeptidase family protein [Actinopolymorpha cephalotaxi]|uniref:Dipeptidyl aminopeptidase/acylaminoacyl peptidase n=1 Tax=Actinopolymorpha cephalotaxi TaxID=504797 RepID=A0A1I3ASE1_9ACTN|nr:prolyl oligopeptidase family serine peptidase [Actinopolymorpha cephalotaxi]NYH86044.1 dipeptidyl aminopeptidase/acylaminoacyl peptidase [Actinopolymorpha cephalotaxi]SFH52997.1 Prolyl oligopeptidase family protein [Actinopolymorpha cephalotaxi]